MGEVWQARLLSHGVETQFAIKVLHETEDDERARNQLLDEARVVSLIRGIHVVSLVEVIDDVHGLALVMDWVDGVSVANLFSQGGKVPLGIALRIVADACAGLHSAHELVDSEGVSLEVVHRDVSPQNLMVGSDGCTRVIDFGIAKARGRLSPETNTGVRGKLSYMSFEHASGFVVDRRADLFSLGAVLYQLVSGYLPYSDASDIEVLGALLVQKPFRPLPEDLPPVVTKLLNRVLAHDREQRFPTALAMQAAIESAMNEANVETSSAMVARHCHDMMPLPAEDITWQQTRKGQRYLPPLEKESQGPSASVASVATATDIQAPVPSTALGVQAIQPISLHQTPKSTDTHASESMLNATVGGPWTVVVAMVMTGILVLYATRAPRTERAMVVRTPENRAIYTFRLQPSPVVPVPQPSRSVLPPTKNASTSLAHAHRLPLSPTTAPNCNPLFEIDANGHKQYKRECLK
jgi:eukaryotic-like serine/threonine-protein kinase